MAGHSRHIPSILSRDLVFPGNTHRAIRRLLFRHSTLQSPERTYRSSSYILPAPLSADLHHVNPDLEEGGSVPAVVEWGGMPAASGS